MYTITCPYCFEQFDHTDVHFRSERVERGEFEGLPEGYDNIQSFRLRFPKGTDKDAIENEYSFWEFFKETDDPKYEAFWRDYGTKTEEDPADQEMGITSYRRKVIDPQNPAHHKFLRAQEDGGYLRYDADGFANEIELNDARRTKCGRRVCPHCHNPLPQEYGKHDVKFISIIGVTGAGKTVYLSKLIQGIEKYVSKVGLSAIIASRSTRTFLKINPVAEGKPLPGSTTKDQFLQPLFYNLVQTTRTHQKRIDSFVIYDIAGENCVDSDKISRFGKFIDHSNGIFLLIDPIQFQIIQGFQGVEEEQAGPTRVLQEIHNHVNHGKSNEKCDIPVAVCISKSDIDSVQEVLEGELADSLMEQVSSIKDERGHGRTVFDAHSYNPIATDLQAFISSNEPDLELMLFNNYSCYNYFAFSSLGCGVEDNAPVGPIIPRRIEEPLFWLFNRFGYIQSNEEVVSFGLPVIRCPACDSTDIKELEGDERERIEGKFFIKKIFYDDYECLECGHRW